MVRTPNISEIGVLLASLTLDPGLTAVVAIKRHRHPRRFISIDPTIVGRRMVTGL